MSTGNRPPRDPSDRAAPPRRATDAAAHGPTLVVTAHPDAALVGAAFEVVEGREAAIGRSAVADVRLDEGSVSRRHARLVPEAEGWRIVDLDSTNGTHVNGLRVRSTLLRDGDSVRIGATVTLRFATSGPSLSDADRRRRALAPADPAPSLTRVLSRERASEETLGRETGSRPPRDRRGTGD
jgi:pSer/pThr/pTyr-binding forkhead associated (FHA) protein